MSCELKKPTMLFFAVALHNLPEGIASVNEFDNNIYIYNDNSLYKIDRLENGFNQTLYYNINKNIKNIKRVDFVDKNVIVCATYDADIYMIDINTNNHKMISKKYLDYYVYNQSVYYTFSYDDKKLGIGHLNLNEEIIFSVKNCDYEKMLVVDDYMYLISSYEINKVSIPRQKRHERLSKAVSDVAPILWQHGALARLDKGESIHDLLHDGYSTLSLGYAGLYECVKYMTGHSHTAEGKEFALEVMKKLNDKCTEWKEAEKIDYSVYGTPIESTTYKFAKCLKDRFGIVEGITDRNYITNSYHVPVFEEIDAFSKLKLESEFQRLSPGGAISYIETPNLQNNIESVLQVIRFIYDNIMYAELNTKSDYCQKCGFDGEILIDEELNWYCPNCGNKDHDTLNVARRTCGYIGSNFWNKGRTEEIKERVLHIDNKDDEI